MGANLVRRLMHDGHRCVVYDVNAEVVKELEREGAGVLPRCRTSLRNWTSPGLPG